MTEILQEEITVFVNTIVDIVHKVGDTWTGLPTNNFGDRYLIMWRLPTQDDVKKSVAGSVQEKEKEKVVEGDGDAPNEEDEPLVVAPDPIKQVRPDAPWLKDEIDEFEDLKDGELDKVRRDMADKALIHAVKTVAEL